ncbi:MAG: acyltransferase [Mycoplasmataceae bacterium]|jgi:peptidoglycan/LPS O-acetylase OafA/YrhL|nr:acyltransferase [Mycoplasmataceae bacterium]
MKQDRGANHKNVRKKIVNRRGGVELLRFVLIFTIIWQHSLSPWVSQSGIFFPIGVTTFFLITGWFSLSLTKSRFLKMLVTTVIYTIIGFVLYIIFYYVGLNDYNPFNIFTDGSFLSDKLTSWWFLYIMLALTLIAPLLNKIFTKINKWYSLAVVIVFWLVIFFWQNEEKSWNIFHYLNLYWIARACMIYLIGAWASLYLFNSLKKYKTISILACLFLVISFILLCVFHNHIYIENPNINFQLVNVCFDISALNLLTGLSLIVLFSFLKTEKFKILNNASLFLGKITLPMYLFHGLCYCVIVKFCPWSTADNSIFCIWITTYISAIAFASLIAYPIDWLNVNVYNWILLKFNKLNIPAIT